MKQIRLIVLLLILSFTGAVAQKLRFNQIGSAEGISSSYISCILQDDKGFMWFGTQDGLNKYDGYQTKVFKNDPTNSKSLNNNEITALIQMRENLMIVGDREGISFFNPVNETFEPLSQLKELHDKINTLCKFSENEILVGSDHGIFLLDVNTRKATKYDFGVSGHVIVRQIGFVNKDVFLTTDGQGLWKLNGNRLERVKITIPDYLKAKPEELLSLSDFKKYSNRLYIGTAGNGVFKIDLSTFEVDDRIQFDREFQNSSFIRKLEVKDNKMYVATGNGFYTVNLLTGRVNSYHKKAGEFNVSNELVKCVFIDRQNNVWIGTELGGVNVAYAQGLKFPSTNDNDESKVTNVYSFLEQKNGDRIVGGNRELKLFDSKGNLKKDYSALLKENYALSLCEDGNFLWVGTWGIGLLRIDLTNGSSKKYLSAEKGGTILTLKKDTRGNIFAGTVGDGLFKLDNAGNVTNYGIKEGLSSMSINTIFEDSKGFVWLGTIDGGLMKMKSYPQGLQLNVLQVFMNEGRQGQIASNVVLGLNEDKNGNLWIATSGGLSKMYPNNNTFRNFYEKDGLPSSYLYAVIADSVNNFWMSSNNGLIKFNPALQEKDITFKSYGLKDGLLNKEYNIGAYYSGPSGTMYFGGVNGFDVFRPTSIRENLNAPKAYVVSYKRGGQDVAVDSLMMYKKALNLSWKENYFQFELVALDYTEPSKNKFKYKLEGYDKEWSSPTNVRYVSYTELPGGDYVFKVKAANNEGIWNETPYELKITVVPPFWKTKWFYVLMVLFAGGCVYAFTQYRTKAIKKENKVLENRVAERTKELAEKNRDITSSIEYAKRIQEAILPAREQIFSKLNRVFILYRPKDIVSGDFYWFGEKNNNRIFAVVDCTGHGVPGAFMSMIGHNLLHQIVQEKGITDPGEILNNLHKGVQEALRQGQNEINTNDGMDVSIISISNSNGEVKWAGANRPLVIFDNSSNLLKYDGNKFPVGGAQLDMSRVFTTHTVTAPKGSMAYMFTDGYADQFGGDKGKKFMVKRFNDILSTIHLRGPEEQKRELEQSFEQWRGNHEQVDDVLVVGIAI